MSQVFISYKREDELRVGRLARALQAEGIDIWWDRGLPGGESWHSNIEAKLGGAGCVVVVWSEHSAGADGGYVREEARRGLARNLLVPVLIDRLDNLPLGFGEIQALDLTRWRGDRGDPGFVDLVATIRAKLAGAPLPAPRGPTKRIARRLLWGSVSSGALAAVLLFALDSFGMASQVCAMRGPQPVLSDACGMIGFGNRPTRAERLAWESRPLHSCAALRDHITRFPEGVFRSTAADLLTARTVSTHESWQPTTRSLALFQSRSSAPSKDEEAAHARALNEATGAAEQLCRNFGAGTLYRYVSAAPVAERWDCGKTAQGVVCGFEGHAACELAERQESQAEHCG